jgi:Arc/MetJ-type ribon-helix-helix transcriptional regulator
MPKQRVTVVLPPELWAQTQRVAHERHTSASEYVARALQEILSREGHEARALAARELVACRLLFDSVTDACDEADDRYDACFDDSGVI